MRSLTRILRVLQPELIDAIRHQVVVGVPTVPRPDHRTVGAAVGRGGRAGVAINARAPRPRGIPDPAMRRPFRAGPVARPLLAQTLDKGSSRRCYPPHRIVIQARAIVIVEGALKPRRAVGLAPQQAAVGNEQERKEQGLGSGFHIVSFHLPHRPHGGRRSAVEAFVGGLSPQGNHEN